MLCVLSTLTLVHSTLHFRNFSHRIYLQKLQHNEHVICLTFIVLVIIQNDTLCEDFCKLLTLQTSVAQLIVCHEKKKTYNCTQQNIQGQNILVFGEIIEYYMNTFLSSLIC